MSALAWILARTTSSARRWTRLSARDVRLALSDRSVSWLNRARLSSLVSPSSCFALSASGCGSRLLRLMEAFNSCGFDSDNIPGTVDLAGCVLTGRDAVYGQHSEAGASIRMRRMDSATPSPSAQISFAFTRRVATNGYHVIALHLYRGFAPVSVRTIATVEPGKALALLQRCRRHLETLGVESIAYRAHREARITAARVRNTG